MVYVVVVRNGNPAPRREITYRTVLYCPDTPTVLVYVQMYAATDFGVTGRDRKGTVTSK
jgi:hypothetical protein